MNINYKKTLFVICTLVLICSALWSVTRQHQSAKETVPQNDYEAQSVGTQNDLAKERYLLTINDGKLCAYRITGNTREPVGIGEFDIGLLSESDASALKKGIYFESFEELCMYFEAYSS